MKCSNVSFQIILAVRSSQHLVHVAVVVYHPDQLISLDHGVLRQRVLHLCLLVVLLVVILNLGGDGY